MMAVNPAGVPENDMNTDQANAEAALYTSKRSGKNRLTIYHGSMAQAL